MHKLTLMILLSLIPCCGCQLIGRQPFQSGPFGLGAPQVVQQQIPGYEQTFPPQQAPFQRPNVNRAGQFLGGLGAGFLRSAVGGAGFTAGRDLWNQIVR